MISGGGGRRLEGGVEGGMRWRGRGEGRGADRENGSGKHA